MMGGLGVDFAAAHSNYESGMTPGNIALCNSGWNYYTNYQCWAYSRAAWEQAAQFNDPLSNTNLYAPSGDLTSEQMSGQASISPSQQAAQGVLNTQAQVQANFENQDYVSAGCTGFFGSIAEKLGVCCDPDTQLGCDDSGAPIWLKYGLILAGVVVGVKVAKGLIVI